MSARPEPTFGRIPIQGSLYGAAIGSPRSDTGEPRHWPKDMAVTPTFSPKVGAIFLSATAERDDPETAAPAARQPCAGGGGHHESMLFEASRPPSVLEEGPPLLESVCPTWACDLDEAALVLFSQPSMETTALRNHPRRLHCRGAVTARPVAADAVSWQPMRTGAPEELLDASGHLFQFSKDGTPTFRVEVHPPPPGRPHDALGRVAVVQACYSPLVAASGLGDPSSLLEFDNPAAHLASMRALGEQLRTDPEIVYVPTSELCAGKQLDHLALRLPHRSQMTPASEARARDAWARTRDFLRTLSTLAADAVDQYTAVEIERTGARELAHGLRAWRTAVP